VPTVIGSPPYLFASRVLIANGLDPRPRRPTFNGCLAPDELGKAVQDGRVDAVATTDPIGTILLGKGIVKTLVDQSVDLPYSDEYCCAAVVSGKLARNNPAAAAKVTRALLKAAKWVTKTRPPRPSWSREELYRGIDGDQCPGALETPVHAGVAQSHQHLCGGQGDGAGRSAQAEHRPGGPDPAGLAGPRRRDRRVGERPEDDMVANGGRPPRLTHGRVCRAVLRRKEDCTCCCRCCIDGNMESAER